jgi:hypothetical protein
VRLPSPAGPTLSSASPGVVIPTRARASSSCWVKTCRTRRRQKPRGGEQRPPPQADCLCDTPPLPKTIFFDSNSGGRPWQFGARRRPVVRMDSQQNVSRCQVPGNLAERGSICGCVSLWSCGVSRKEGWGGGRSRGHAIAPKNAVACKIGESHHFRS